MRYRKGVFPYLLASLNLENLTMSNEISITLTKPYSTTEAQNKTGINRSQLIRILKYLDSYDNCVFFIGKKKILKFDDRDIQLIIDFKNTHANITQFLKTQTFLKKYGVTNPLKSNDIKEKSKQTCLKKYGTEYALQSKEVKEKSKKTCLNKYGVERYSQTTEYTERYKQTCIDRYGVENASQSSIIKEKVKQTCLDKYGVEYSSQYKENRDKYKQTCLEKYGYTTYTQTDEYKNKSKNTCLSKYGVENVSQEYNIQEKMRNTCLKKYGVSHPSQNPEIHSKMLSHKDKTSPEKKLEEFLKNRGFDYQYEYECNGKNFDFAIFKNDELSILIEIDGEYFHGLKNDYDNYHVHGEKDCERFSLVPDNVKLIVCDSLRVEECFKEILSVFNIDYSEWVKNIIESLPSDFPYPEYDNKRLEKDYKNLCEYSNIKKTGRLADSTIRQFHKSIWTSRLYNFPSPVEAWQDKELLEKCVRNRFIYSSSLSSQAIVNGFNVCKLAPKVSVFSASLAKYLIQKYLNDYDTIFDPFSGFSGRMLGTCACGKKYIGQDINEDHVRESNEIIKFHNLEAIVNCKDSLNEKGEYNCLFTCPPYNLKENWNNINQSNLSCDEWIDSCLSNYKCSKYLFVVNSTKKYENFIVESIQNNSHISNSKEYVILL